MNPFWTDSLCPTEVGKLRSHSIPSKSQGTHRGDLCLPMLWPPTETLGKLPLPKEITLRSEAVVVDMFSMFSKFWCEHFGFPAVWSRKFGFRKVREVCRIHFHLFWYLYVSMGPSYHQKTKKHDYSIQDYWSLSVTTDKKARKIKHLLKTYVRGSFFLFFGPWAPELFVFDLSIWFVVKNYICSPQDMSRIPKVGQKSVENYVLVLFLLNEIWVKSRH